MYKQLLVWSDARVNMTTCDTRSFCNLCCDRWRPHALPHTHPPQMSWTSMSERSSNSWALAIFSTRAFGTSKRSCPQSLYTAPASPYRSWLPAPSLKGSSFYVRCSSLLNQAAKFSQSDYEVVLRICCSGLLLVPNFPRKFAHSRTTVCLPWKGVLAAKRPPT